MGFGQGDMRAGADAEQWYFAYGSNLWIDQMIARTGPADRGRPDPESRISFMSHYIFGRPSSEADWRAEHKQIAGQHNIGATGIELSDDA